MKTVIAAFIFFTRLPLWRIKIFATESENFKNIINFWPLTGWVTAAVMAGVLWLSSSIFPYSISILMAILSRILFTGALHEDGLADFLDGFGCGTNRQRVLEIMKDSHIGTYGVTGLILYFFILFQLFYYMDIRVACISILVADPLCKSILTLITRFLPYARTEESSKIKTVYSKISFSNILLSLSFGFLPFFIFFDIRFWFLPLIPILIFCILVVFMKRKLQGYTGDCCGAAFLICEISFYTGLVAFLFNT